MGQTPIRGTQSFVRTLSEVWRRPGLTALEILWRWMIGVPAAALIGYETLRVVRETRVDFSALKQMTVVDPGGAAATLSGMAVALGPSLLQMAEWLAPLLLAVWVVVSSAGRVAVLLRIDPQAKARVGTVIVLQAIRIAALAGSFAVWFAGLRAAAGFAVSGPIAAGQEPNILLYCAIAIVTTLGLFTLWAVVSWALSVAPLMAVLHDMGPWKSLRAAIQVGPVRSKLVEINLVIGIVKIALIVLAMVLSACPLPFESVATPGFMLRWYGVVTVLYLVASDMFHVVRLMSYVEMLKVHEGDPVGAFSQPTGDI